ncbi:replicative DNA helicase [Vibrio astriarenae]|nr:replicative DNA helicase [Vibrio sp. C7]
MADRQADFRASSNSKKKNDAQVDAIKVPPHSIEAEQSVIGGLLLDNERWDTVAERVVTNDFYSRPHRLIFESARDLLEAGKPLDLITLSEFLEQREQLEDVGGFAYLADLAKNTPSAANINAYADIVAERALVRNLIGVANEIADAGYDPQAEAPKIYLILLRVRFSKLLRIVLAKMKVRKTLIRSSRKR